MDLRRFVILACLLYPKKSEIRRVCFICLKNTLRLASIDNDISRQESLQVETQVHLGGKGLGE